MRLAADEDDGDDDRESALMDVETARTRLEEMLGELDRSSDTLERAEDSGAPSALDPHAGEAASDLTEHERDAAMLEVVDQQRTEVRQALERIDSGSYGSCVDCGDALSPDRLDARPEAARCLDCQTTMEHAR